jgi:hypothetical protein
MVSFTDDTATTRREIGLALYSNGNEIGLALADVVGNMGQFETYDMESTLNLKSGDQVWLAIKYKSTDSYVFDNFQHHNHFTRRLASTTRFRQLGVDLHASVDKYIGNCSK